MKTLIQLVVGLTPVTINILFIPISLVIGLILIAMMNDIWVDECKNDSEEYKKYKRERDFAITGAVIGTASGLRQTRKGLKEITDADNWNSKV